MIQLVVKTTCDCKINSNNINQIFVSQPQKEVLKAIVRVLSEHLYLSEYLIKPILYKSIKLVLFAYEFGNCFILEQKFNSEERRVLYDKIRDHFLLFLENLIRITPEQRKNVMELNEYFVPLVEAHYSLNQRYLTV